MNESQKRRLTDYHINSRFERLTTYEGYDFAFVPEGKEPETAWWRFDKVMKRHNIVMNSAIDKLVTRSKKLRDKFLFAMRVYDHEAAHSLETERDSEKMQRLLKEAKIPWHLCNLFEDARIEARWRKRFKRRFNWLRYLYLVDEDPEIKIIVEGEAEIVPIKPAIRLFLDCKNMENSYRKIREWVALDKDPKIAYQGVGKARYGRRNLIWWFYRRAIRAHSTISLIPMLKSWIKTFPETAGTGAPGVGLIIIDIPQSGREKGMPTNAEDADGSPHIEIAGTISVSGSSAGTKSKPPPPRKEEEEVRGVKRESTILEIPKSVFFDPDPFRTIDFKRGDRLIRLFERFLEGGETTVTTRAPSSKLSMRRWLQGAEDFYLRKGEDPAGIKRISFLMDCSGSMSRALEDGVYLAYVLNELVRRGKLECKNMIVCGGSSQAVPMPFNPEILRYLRAPGAIEGFAPAMRTHAKDLLESDLSIFFTDGDIVDEHIDKAYWHVRGVYSIGLFVGAPDRTETLHQWFDSVLVRRNIEAIADSLIQIIKR